MDQAQEGRTPGIAVTSLILGISSIAVCLGLFTAIPAVICGHIAYSRIKGAGGMLKGQGTALAGLITGYIGIAFGLVVIPMMAAIVIPSLVKARSETQKALCANNLRLIDDAVDEVMTRSNFVSSSSVTKEMVGEYLKSGAIENMHWPEGATIPTEEQIRRCDSEPLAVTINGEVVTISR